MRRTLRAVALLLVAALALVVPASSASPAIPTDPATLAGIAEWAGCTAVTLYDVRTSDEAFNAYFGVTPATGQPAIILVNRDAVPDQHVFTVFLHELAHCLQYKDGSIFRLGHPEVELDADGRAAQLACALHMDGPRMLRELFEWINQTYGYEGDPDHGTLAERVSRGSAARSYCPAYEMPLMTQR